MKTIIIAVATIATVIAWNSHKEEELNALREYHIQAESLLDSLDNEYNWVDAIDHEGYYNATHHLKTITKAPKN
jgi:hypothetical protein